jgi:amidase
LRIAFTVDPPIPYPVDDAVVRVARDAADALAALGHELVEGTPPWVDDVLLSTFAKLWQVGPALYPADPELFEPLNRALAAAAHETSSVILARSVTALQRLARRIVSFWDDVDVVLTPGLAKLPVPIGWVFEPEDPWEQFRRGGAFTPFTPIVNVTGQPAAMVPFGVVDGLPVGVHLVGRPADEATLFRLAAQIEAAHPWADRLPTFRSPTSRQTTRNAP